MHRSPGWDEPTRKSVGCPGTPGIPYPDIPPPGIHHPVSTAIYPSAQLVPPAQFAFQALKARNISAWSEGLGNSRLEAFPLCRRRERSAERVVTELLSSNQVHMPEQGKTSARSPIRAGRRREPGTIRLHDPEYKYIDCLGGMNPARNRYDVPVFPQTSIRETQAWRKT